MRIGTCSQRSKTRFQADRGRVFDLEFDVGLLERLAAEGLKLWAYLRPADLARCAHPHEDLIEYAQMVYERYGADRMLWASDFPFAEPGCAQLLELVDRSFPDLGDGERRAVLGRTCARLFGL